ncbi:partial Chitodextrinase, partial [Burkholderiaceae bacterium]
ASQTASPGAARSFTLTVTNRNTSACGTSTFALSQVLPSGFSGSFSSSSLALGAGSSGSVTWTAASGSTAVPATYTLDATAADSANSTSRTTSHASYIIYAADSTPPSVSITSPSATTISSRTTLSIAASASDASGIQAVEFHGDGKLLARDTSAPYSANWNLRKVGKGSHTIKARAIDNAGNAAEQSVTITVN